MLNRKSSIEQLAKICVEVHDRLGDYCHSLDVHMLGTLIFVHLRHNDLSPFVSQLTVNSTDRILDP